LRPLVANIGGMEQPLWLRRATDREYSAVVDLIDTVREWLRQAKDTDQWLEPWPTENGRNARIRAAILAGRTWVAWDGTRAAATVTISPRDHEIWPEENRRDPAVYVRRLVVDRAYAGQHLGAQLLDWAGLRATREYGARWVRVDLWTTNTELHDYYRRQGFEFCGFCETIEDYPSAALFQKPVHQIKPPEELLFRELPEAG
jgi:GNAT superfamily N-acetyltransferase